MTDAARKALPPKLLAYLRDAERRGRTAVSLYHVAIARSLLLALVKKVVMSASQYDAMFKRVYEKMKPALCEEVEHIPRANLAK